jgi:hypothetical protein
VCQSVLHVFVRQPIAKSEDGEKSEDVA